MSDPTVSNDTTSLPMSILAAGGCLVAALCLSVAFGLTADSQYHQADRARATEQARREVLAIELGSVRAMLADMTADRDRLATRPASCPPASTPRPDVGHTTPLFDAEARTLIAR